MADVNANIGVNIDTSEALAQLKALQRQISQFHTSIAKSSETAGLAQRDLQKNFLNSVNAIGAFSAELRTVRTTAESFTDSLEKNKFSMREYFRFAGGSTKTFGKLFKSEFDTIGKVAEDRVKRLQTQYIKLGRDTSGAMKAIAIMPNQLDMSNFSTQSQIAAQKQAIFNQLVKQGSTNLLNFGKNTQWAGRQLMVGFTLPLAALGTVATRTFMDMEAATIKFRKVYGDLFTPKSETDAALENITALGQSFTQYGVAVSQTVGLASEAAAAGFSGLDLQRQTIQATRLSILGQVESQKALETTISLQNAFKMSSEDLASSIDFLNAVENQTVVSLDDITTAIPKVAPVIQQLGGDVKDLAFFMAAMKEGGINASEGANALKSGLAALINPTTKASAMLEGYGININKIIEGNQGDLKTTVIEFARALDTLDPLTRARAIEQLFGKFQFARLSTLFSNVINETGQASRVLDLAGTSIEDLAALSESELGITADSAMNKFRKSVEDLKFALVPVGETFLQAVTPIVEFAGSILEKFNNLSSGVKKALVVLTVAIGAIGPVALMTFGLLANGIANIVKGAMILRNGYLRLTGQSQILGEQTEYLTMEQIDAAAASHSLDQSHARLIQTFTAETGAIGQLITAYQQGTTAAAKFAAINPGMMRAPTPKKFATGGIVEGPGSGTSDSILAMVSNGEAIIPAKNVNKYPELTAGLVAGNIPGFKNGLEPSSSSGMVFAHGIAPVTLSPEAMKALSLVSQSLNRSLSQATRATGFTNMGFVAPQNLNKGKMAGEEAGQFFKQNAELATSRIYKSIVDLLPAAASDPNVKKDVILFGENIGKELTLAGSNAVSDPDFYNAVSKALETTMTQATTQAFKESLPKIQKQITAIGVFGGEINRGERGQRTSLSRVAQQKAFGYQEGMVSYKSQTLSSQLKKQGFAEGSEISMSAVAGAKQGAGTQSPSKKTIPIGEDIARGLQVGMANQQDEVSASGQSLGSAAVGGTQNGARQRRRATRPAGPATSVASAPAIVETKSRLDSMNKALMGGTFALTSLAGAGSMAGGTIGKLSNQVMKYSGLLFALMSVTQLLTQAQFARLIAERAATAGILKKTIIDSATGAASFSRTTGLFSGGIKQLLPNLLRFGGMIAKMIGPIGALIGVIGVSVGLWKKMNSVREQERLSIEGISDAMKTTTEQVKTLGDFFGVVPNKLSFGVAPREFVTSQTRTQRDTLKADEGFQNEFKSTLAQLRKATNAEAKLIFSSLALNLKAQGFASDQVQVIVDALREESGKTDVVLDLKSLNLSPESLAQLQGQLAPFLLTLNKELQKPPSGLEKFITGIRNHFSGIPQQVMTLSKASQKALSESSTFISQMAISTGGMLKLGLTDAATYESTLNALLKTTEGLTAENRRLLLLDVFKKMEIDATGLVNVIGNARKEMMLLALSAAGAIPQSVLDDLKATGEDAAFRNARGQAGLLAAYKKLQIESKKVEEDDGDGGDVTDLNDKKESAFDLAIKKLQEQQKELKNTSKAYGILEKAGIDAETALKYASDPVIALGIATGKIDPTKINQVKKLMEDIERSAGSAAIRDFLVALEAENTLKKDFDKIIPRLITMGATTEEIKDILGNPMLMKSFVDEAATAEQITKRIERYLSAIKEGKAIDIKFNLKLSPEEAKNELKQKANDFFSFLERVAQREYKTKIIDKEKEVKKAQDTVDEIQKEIDDIQKGIDIEQRNIEEKITRPIEEYQEQINDLQRTIEINFERPLAALADESSVLSEQLTLIDKAAEDINSKYDKQEEALQKISDINQDISNQKKQQIGLADALSRGDIAAAAQAAQEMRASQAEAASRRSGSFLQAARQAEIAGLRSPSGLTRTQIEERQYKIERESYKLNLDRKKTDEAILKIQDDIYKLEEDREEKVLAIRKQEDLIYDITKKRLDPAKKNLETAEKNLAAVKEELDKRLANIDAQKDAWELAADAEFAAKVNAGDYNDVIEQTVDYLNQVLDLWKEIVDISSGGAYVAPRDTPESAAALDEFISIVEKLDAAQLAYDAAVESGNMYGVRNTGIALTAAQKEYDATLPVIDPNFVGGGGGTNVQALSSGGMVKPKYFSVGGKARGTDIVPAMLTPGEFVMSKYAVSSYGVDKMKAINSGTYEGEKVYNYNLSVNVKSDANPDDIARVVMTQIKQIDSQRIRTQRA